MTPLTPDEFLASQNTMPPQQRLDALIQVLRGPQGCPWDQRQTAASILDFVIDEAHELKEALAQGDSEAIKGELGDLSFTFTFLRQTLAEQASEAAAVGSVVEKMIVRHPHVFQRTEAGPVGEAEIKRKWETLKAAGGGGDRRLDHDLPASLSAWQKAAKILTRARNAGFRYPHPEAAWEKVEEEWRELREALEQQDEEHSLAELGDLLLALLTASMEAGLQADRALTEAGKRLADRLQEVEKLAGRPLGEIPYGELAGLYARARVARSAEIKNDQPGRA